MKSNKVLTGLMAAALVAVPLAGCSAQATETATADTASTAAASEAEAAAALIGDDFNTLDTNGVKLTFWHSMGGVNGEAMTALVDKFNQENQYGITVEAVYQGSYDDAINKLKSAQIGNMGADLVQIYDIGTRFMIDSGLGGAHAAAHRRRRVRRLPDRAQHRRLLHHRRGAVLHAVQLLHPAALLTTRICLTPPASPNTRSRVASPRWATS